MSPETDGSVLDYEPASSKLQKNIYKIKKGLCGRSLHKLHLKDLSGSIKKEICGKFCHFNLIETMRDYFRMKLL
jgi:hypothetical protein